MHSHLNEENAMEDRVVRVETNITKSKNDKLTEYAKLKYNGNRRLVINEALNSLIARKGL